MTQAEKLERRKRLVLRTIEVIVLSVVACCVTTILVVIGMLP